MAKKKQQRLSEKDLREPPRWARELSMASPEFPRTDPNDFWTWQAGTHLGMPFRSGDTDTDPSLSADGSKLYFVSDRPGGRGGLDIWVLDIKKKQK